MGTDNTRASPKSLQKEKAMAKNAPKRLKNVALSVKECRKNKASKLMGLTLEHLEIASKFRDLHPKRVGRPRLEDTQQFLLETIVDIVNHHTAAEPRRWNESMRTCKTLDDLRLELLARGTKLVTLG